MKCHLIVGLPQLILHDILFKFYCKIEIWHPTMRIILYMYLLKYPYGYCLIYFDNYLCTLKYLYVILFILAILN